MKSYSFHSDENVAIQPHYIFNHPSHLLLQSNDGWKCFSVRDEKQKTIATLWLHFKDEIGQSPFRAPFGSVEFIEPCDTSILYEFIAFIVRESRNVGVQKLSLKYFPESYDARHHSLVSSVLFNHGFTIDLSEISSVIPITNTPYDNHVTEWEKRKLKQAKTAHLRFKKNSNDDLKNVYQFISDCRQGKNYQLSMYWEDLEKLAFTFPEAIHCFSTNLYDQVASACIAIQVSKDVLYTFYYDHSKDFHQLSPVVLLIEGIYDFCKASHIRLLDLGTATVNNQPNFPLLRFKQHLGGQPSLKLIVSKQL